METKAKFLPTSDGPRLTTKEYNQLMAMIRKNNSGNSQHFLNAISINMSSSKIISNYPHSNMCWIIDSGTTNHVTSSTEFLVPKNLPRTTTISLPNGGQAHIESIGSLHITPHIKLDEALKVPQFRVNLISISKLTQALQCIMIFFSDFYVVQGATTRKTIGLGKQYNGLYYLTQDQNPALAYTIHKHSDLWHQRLTHPSSNRLQVLAKINPKIYFDFKHVCEICLLAKQARLFFPSSLISSHTPFDLIHCNSWGPHQINSHFGAHYFLTIVDDYT